MRLLLDNSALGLLHCKRKFQLTVVQGLTKPDQDSTTDGSAFHTLQEYLRKGHTSDEAIAATQAKHPTLKDIYKPLRSVTLYRGLTKLPDPVLINGVPAIEHKFSFHYGSFIVANRPDPIEVYLCGTIDDLHLDGEILVFLDYKHSDAFTPAHQDRIMDTYLLAFQLPFYVWALYKSGSLPADLMERIERGLYRSELHFIFGKAEPPRIRKQRRPAFPYDFLFKEVPAIVNSKIAQAIDIISTVDAAPRDGFCVYGACSSCAFKLACAEVGTDKEVEYLSRFPAKIYNPMEFR
jgi:hypothetical protein